MEVSARLCRAPVPLIGPGEGKISKSTLRGTQWDSTPYSIPQRPHTGRGSVLVVAAVFVVATAEGVVSHAFGCASFGWCVAVAMRLLRC